MESEAVGIKVEGESKWLTLIQIATNNHKELRTEADLAWFS